MTSRDLDGKESRRAPTESEARSSAFGVAAAFDDAPVEPVPSTERASRHRPRRATELRGPGLEVELPPIAGRADVAARALRAQESLRRKETQAYGEALKKTPKAPLGPRPGEVFGNYTIVSLLAQGGTSEVYQAQHVGLKKQVALKVLRADFSQYDEARQDFLREGENAASIRHPHIVDVTDLGEVDGLPFIVMELLIGRDLAITYREQAPLPIPCLVDLMLPIVFATAAGHAQGVVHGDLKPGNVFLHWQGQRVVPKLLDFGLSRRFHERRSASSARVFGTPHYMAPEQARGVCGADELTDQYAFGVMLYEGATARLPHDADEPGLLLQRVGYEPFVLPSQLVALPEAFEVVVLRLMAGQRGARFGSMLDAAAALIPFASPAAQPFWWRELGLSAPATANPQLGLEPENTLVTAADRSPSLPPPAPVEDQLLGELEPAHGHGLGRAWPPPPQPAMSRSEPPRAFFSGEDADPEVGVPVSSEGSDAEPRFSDGPPEGGRPMAPAIEAEIDTVQAEIDEDPIDPNALIDAVADVEFEEVRETRSVGPAVPIVTALSVSRAGAVPQDDRLRFQAASAVEGVDGADPLGLSDAMPPYQVDSQFPGMPTPLWRRPGVWVMAAGVLAASISLSRLIRYDRPTLPKAMTTTTIATTVTSAAVDPSRTRVEVEIEPPSAVVELDGIQVGVGSYQGSIEKDGQTHRLRASAPGFEPQTIEFGAQPPPERLRLRPLSLGERTQTKELGAVRHAASERVGSRRARALERSGGDRGRPARSAAASGVEPRAFPVGAAEGHPLEEPSVGRELRSAEEARAPAQVKRAGLSASDSAQAALEADGVVKGELGDDEGPALDADGPTLEPQADRVITPEQPAAETGGKPQVKLIEGRKQPVVQLLE